MAFKFENLKVWNISLDMSVEIKDLAILFLKHELYNLSIRKAGDWGV